MTNQGTRVLFAHLVGRPEEEIDLGEAALVIASLERPSLDVAVELRRLDELASRAREALGRGGEPLLAVARLLYDELGFRGNTGAYYDPNNSFLDQVLERRTGIPITLAVVILEVCRRAGVAARGVSFPGHFLVRADVKEGMILLDPFTGKPLSLDELRALYHRAVGRTAARGFPADLLEPATKVQTLARLLTNLRAIYEKESDARRLRAVSELLEVVAPTTAGEAQGKAPASGATPKRRTSTLN